MIRGVLFDLDGTLLDTAPDMISALNFVRGMEFLEPVPVEEFKHLISGGAPGLIGGGMPASDNLLFEHRKSALLKRYSEFLYEETVFFDGVETLLQALEEKGVPWGIVTNKMEYLALPLLEATGLLKRAGCVICGDTLKQKKPHPAPVQMACQLIACENFQTLMVGDDLKDLQAGQAAGTHTALALYGYVEPGVQEQNLNGSFRISAPGEVMRLLNLHTEPVQNLHNGPFRV